ncbi:MAG: ATP-binding protein [Rhodospirillales bacterium]|nr:ATP-binding protein [Rhodospirillales bacterium]
MRYLPRPRELEAVRARLLRGPVTALLGPRQCGKTTLAQALKPEHFFDLEDPRSLARLDEPQTALEGLTGTVVIDEVQRKPDLFPLLRVLADRARATRFLLLGSASPDLVKEVSESLAGRVGYHHLGPLAIDETGVSEWRALWLRGGFPRSYLAEDEATSAQWREDFVRSYLERDIPALGVSIPAETLRRFWVMVSHYHGQTLNLSELGRSFGVSDHTVRRYLEILSGTFMIRLLPPWHANVGKRLVKAPKLYIRDSGLFHTLHAIVTRVQLESHPKLGASWEGFAMEQAIRLMGVANPYFWRTHTGAELDLVWQADGALWGMEFKYRDAPRMTRSIRAVLRDLPLKHVWIVYPGPEPYQLDDAVSVLPVADLPDAVNGPIA